MSLNQNITKALLLYSGSIVSSTLPDGTNAALTLPSASLPAFTTSSFNYGFLQTPVFTLGTAQVEISELKLSLGFSSRYLITGYILAGSFSNTTGNRIGLNFANTTTNIYNIETPDSITSVVLGINQTAAPVNSPSSTPTNIYCTIIRAIVVTGPSPVGIIPTVVPTFSTETNLVTVTIGPSFMYALQY